MGEIANPPAFPSEQHETQDGSWNQTYCDGMSLRDWFAGKLAAAEVASAGANIEAAEALADAAVEAGMTIPQRIAFNAYEVADAMLAARVAPPAVELAPVATERRPFKADPSQPRKCLTCGQPDWDIFDCIPF